MLERLLKAMFTRRRKLGTLYETQIDWGAVILVGIIVLIAVS